MEDAKKTVARRGEPWITFFEPEVFHRQLESKGFHLIEDLGPEELRALYFGGRKDKLDVSGVFRMAALRIAAAAPNQ